ncbi:MAG TPA: DNA topoisomerase VI subunit B, partial [Nitrospira sp.]|nr:DNA topoisomerase VI subunit B [Nitrospira sp.]
VEACNRLKGGKLAKEKLKMQLQKIANSRTGGSKTDEALGKTGGGPEGLPHSIIVSDEGIEGEVAAASQVETAEETAGPEESDLLGAPAAPPAPKSQKSAHKSTRPHQSHTTKSRRKSDQMALFDKAADAKSVKKGVDRPKPKTAHRKK